MISRVIVYRRFEIKWRVCIWGVMESVHFLNLEGDNIRSPEISRSATQCNILEELNPPHHHLCRNLRYCRTLFFIRTA